MTEDAEPGSYRVRLSQNAAMTYAAIPSKKDLARVNKVLDLLDTVPDIGHAYDPLYESAKPPFDLRVVFAGNYGIYYAVDEAAKAVDVFYLEDQRKDPLTRFEG